eukprot:6048642-Amphidinium_carterae.1
MAPKLSKSWTARGGFRQCFGLDRLRPDCKRVFPNRATKGASRGKRGRPPAESVGGNCKIPHDIF